MKSRAAGKFGGRIMANSVHKEPKRSRTSGKFVFLLLFPLILGNSKKYIFPTDIDKGCFVSKAQLPSEKVKITRGLNFSSLAEFFRRN
jgi:hypothetical protein